MLIKVENLTNLQIRQVIEENVLGRKCRMGWCNVLSPDEDEPTWLCWTDEELEKEFDDPGHHYHEKLLCSEIEGEAETKEGEAHSVIDGWAVPDYPNDFNAIYEATKGCQDRKKGEVQICITMFLDMFKVNLRYSPLHNKHFLAGHIESEGTGKSDALALCRAHVRFAVGDEVEVKEVRQ